MKIENNFMKIKVFSENELHPFGEYLRLEPEFRVFRLRMSLFD